MLPEIFSRYKVYVSHLINQQCQYLFYKDYKYALSKERSGFFFVYWEAERVLRIQRIYPIIYPAHTSKVRGIN